MINYVLQSGWGTGARHRIRRLFERNNEQKKEPNNTRIGNIKYNRSTNSEQL
jgi:hypothetical protein